MTEHTARRTRLLTVAEHPEAVGGAEIAQLRVVEGLAAEGWEVELLAVRAGDLSTRWEAVAATTRVVAASQPRRDAPVGSGLASLRTLALVARSRAEVIYLHNPAELVVALPAARLGRKPVVVHLHLPPPSGQPAWLNRLLRGVDAVVVPSEDARRRWSQTAGLRADAVTAIPTGIDGSGFAPLGEEARRGVRQLLGLAVDRPVVLYAGRVDPTKGVRVLVDAVRAMQVPVQLAICGPETDPVFAAELRRTTRDEDVAWLGRQRELAPVLASVDVTVLPSLVPETQGLVVAEAMSCGTPAVGSSVGGLPETLAGFPDHLFPAGDAEALAARLDRLADWRRTQPGLGAASRQWVGDHLDVRTTVRAVSGVLDRAGRT
ncbi:MAG: glycosyltransferase family 4 protein [Acidimicrobiales bacterium]|nr:glycosyltransferase family 4 protein [Acidimicrobiales bacterium]